MATEFHEPPTGPVKATVDGQVTSYFEWLGSGVYRVNQRTGAMHGQRFFVHELSIRERWPEPVSAPRFRGKFESSRDGVAAERAVGCLDRQRGCFAYPCLSAETSNGIEKASWESLRSAFFARL